MKEVIFNKNDWRYKFYKKHSVIFDFLDSIPFPVYLQSGIGLSMYPTLEDKSTTLDSKIFFRLNRGDIVSFTPCISKKRLFQKRIIGIPGDTIHFSNGTLYLNGKPLEEKYVLKKNNTRQFAESTIVLKKNQYYLMGDNRDDSYDSRELGPVNRCDIKAKVLKIYKVED